MNCNPNLYQYSKYNDLTKRELKTLCRERGLKLSREGNNNSYCLRINLVENDLGKLNEYYVIDYITFTKLKTKDPNEVFF